MIGVAKNHSVSRFGSRSRMSRKCTVSADRISAHASVGQKLHGDDDREPEELADRERRVVDQEGGENRQPEEEVHHVRQRR